MHEFGTKADEGYATDLLEFGEIPRMVLSWIMAGIVRAGDMRHPFWVHTYMPPGVETVC
jgi:hypothetical protein